MAATELTSVTIARAMSLVTPFKLGRYAARHGLAIAAPGAYRSFFPTYARTGGKRSSAKPLLGRRRDGTV